MEYLLDCGANPLTKNGAGKTAFVAAGTDAEKIKLLNRYLE